MSERVITVWKVLVLAASSVFALPAWAAASLTIDLAPVSTNAVAPQMGDQLVFRSVIRNTGDAPAPGVVAWLTLIQLDPGHEQPIDLEDWSAHKAETRVALNPGQAVTTDWPIRLIQSGRYRVIVSVITRDSSGLAASPFADFTVRTKPVVESTHVIPVAIGVPLILLAGLVLGLRRSNR